MSAIGIYHRYKTPTQTDILAILQETTTKMKLVFQDFTWFHPDYEQQLKEFLLNHRN